MFTQAGLIVGRWALLEVDRCLEVRLGVAALFLGLPKCTHDKLMVSIFSSVDQIAPIDGFYVNRCLQRALIGHF